jgi:hypothetical protein
MNAFGVPAAATLRSIGKFLADHLAGLRGHIASFSTLQTEMANRGADKARDLL